MMAAADAFAESGFFASGYRSFHLDDCWAGGRNSSGFVYGDKGHFPNGMKKVVDYVHGKGMVFGLYVSWLHNLLTLPSEQRPLSLGRVSPPGHRPPR